jgi:hypothetical protein
MSTQTAAVSLIQEFVASDDFAAGLQKFMESGGVRSDNLLGILRQYVTSPTCDEAHIHFWRSPQKEGPESQFDNDVDNQE